MMKRLKLLRTIANFLRLYNNKNLNEAIILLKVKIDPGSNRRSVRATSKNLNHENEPISKASLASKPNDRILGIHVHHARGRVPKKYNPALLDLTLFFFFYFLKKKKGNETERNERQWADDRRTI